MFTNSAWSSGCQPPVSPCFSRNSSNSMTCGNIVQSGYVGSLQRLCCNMNSNQAFPHPGRLFLLSLRRCSKSGISSWNFFHPRSDFGWLFPMHKSTQCLPARPPSPIPILESRPVETEHGMPQILTCVCHSHYPNISHLRCKGGACVAVASPHVPIPAARRLTLGPREQ